MRVIHRRRTKHEPVYVNTRVSLGDLSFSPLLPTVTHVRSSPNCSRKLHLPSSPGTTPSLHPKARFLRAFLFKQHNRNVPIPTSFQTSSSLVKMRSASMEGFDEFLWTDMFGRARGMATEVAKPPHERPVFPRPTVMNNELPFHEKHVLPTPVVNKLSGKSAASRMLVTFFSFLALFVVCFLVTHCGGSNRSILPATELLHTQPSVLGEPQHLERRSHCNKTVLESSAAAATTAAATDSTSPFTPGSALPTAYNLSSSSSTMTFTNLATPVGVSVAVSTHTAISVIYSFYTTPGSSSAIVPTVLPATTIPGQDDCTCPVDTETVSVIITVVPSTLGDATVTGSPSTVTNINTDLSFTSGLPDVTVSGNPSTLTEIRTDVSYTSGLPDATVSGFPSTVTDIQTDVSLTSGLPDATVSGNPSTLTQIQTDLSLTTGLPDATVTGNPSTATDMETSFYGPAHSTVTMTTVVVISDLWGPWSSSLTTATDVSTTLRTITTVYSSLWTVVITDEAPGPSSTAVSSIGDVASSKAEGQGNTMSSSPAADVVTTVHSPVTATATVVIGLPPFPSSNGTASSHASGTVSHTAPPATSVVVISNGNKKPGPRGLGGSGGTSNLGCTVMLIALVVFLL